MFDRVLRGYLRSTQQQLPLEQGPIERASAQEHTEGIVEREIRTEE